MTPLAGRFSKEIYLILLILILIGSAENKTHFPECHLVMVLKYSNSGYDSINYVPINAYKWYFITIMNGSGLPL